MKDQQLTCLAIQQPYSTALFTNALHGPEGRVKESNRLQNAVELYRVPYWLVPFISDHFYHFRDDKFFHVEECVFSAVLAAQLAMVWDSVIHTLF